VILAGKAGFEFEKNYIILCVDETSDSSFYLMGSDGKTREEIPKVKTYPEAIRWVRSTYKADIKQISLR
jgi:hypothetical protein